MAIRPLFFLHLLLLFSKTLLFNSVSALDFVFNGFDPSDLLLFSNATLNSSVVTLTTDVPFAIGRCLFPTKIRTKASNSSRVLPFSTSFIFSMAPYRNRLPGHGIVFLFVPFTGIQGSQSSQNLGFINRTNDRKPDNHIFGVEFDVFKNQEFNDIDDNHVGVDLNSLTSTAAKRAGYWRDIGGGGDSENFEDLKLNNGVNYQAWIDYRDSQLNVTMAPAGVKRPRRPLISVSLDLSGVLLDEMYVGFTSATGRLVQSHRILAWSFSNSNLSIGEALETSNLPSFVLPKRSVLQSKRFIIAITVASVFVVGFSAAVALFLISRKQRNTREGYEMEDWELEYWPHRIPYQELHSATNSFSEENVIGIGGHGKVYRGVLKGGAEVAVKRISHETDEGIREFLAEVSSLGRLKHRNLVGLRGWCKKERGSLILVYDYMENGSLDKRVFECEEKALLSWEDRVRVLKDVASGVLYLHEGWDSRVLHRDIKSSNVLLDKEINGRLADFGLARIYDHGQVASSTRVVGTVGYMAPELVRSGRASVQTDVFGFGMLILEVVCGRRPMEEGKPPLVNWVWEKMERGELVSAMDERLRGRGGYDDEEVERVLHLGLLCSYPDARARPSMRQVVKLLEGTSDLEESEGAEGMDVFLLDKMKSTAMWSSHRHGLKVGGAHPTFDEIRQSLSSSISLSGSDYIITGR